MTSRFVVQLEPSGRRLAADGERSILDVALDAGLNLPHSCKSGHCTSCRARLLEGEVSYPRGWPAGLGREEAAAGRVLLCQARARSDLRIEVRAPQRAAPLPEIRAFPCRVAALEPLSADVLRVLLQPPSTEALEFLPGQYLDVLLPDHRRRSFSIASPPHDAGRLELHLRRAGGDGFTARFFAEARVGTLLRVEAPIGQFVYEHDGARPAVFVAGGTGFAPVKSMLRHALERCAPRALRLWWGVRTAADAYEDELLLAWSARQPLLEYRVVLSDAAAEPGRAHHSTGWVHEPALAALAEAGDADVYVAGPPALVEAMRAGFEARGLDAARLRFDSFDYAPR